MGKLIRFEFHKLFRMKSFYIITGLFIALNLYSVYLTNDYAFFRTTSLDNALMMMCSSDFLMLFGIFAALFTCDDYSGTTIRNILSRGFTRTQVYISKFIVLIVAELVMMLLSVLIVFLYSSSLWETGLSDFDGDMLLKVTEILLLLIAFAAVYYAISTAIGKTGLSVAVCLLLDVVVTLVIGVVVLVLDLEDMSILEYWVSTILGNVYYGDIETSTALIGAGGYLAGSFILGYISIFKREF